MNFSKELLEYTFNKGWKKILKGWEVHLYAGRKRICTFGPFDFKPKTLGAGMRFRSVNLNEGATLTLCDTEISFDNSRVFDYNPYKAEGERV
jgi:hypothetical protein